MSHKLLEDETRPRIFFLIWEEVHGMCASPATNALDSDKTVFVQSGLSLARVNLRKEKKDGDFYTFFSNIC